jgi:ADP-heptose:LPS heptosyltransferase
MKGIMMNSDAESTLVVRGGEIGDLVILSSSLRNLKKRTPWRPLILATLPEHVPLLKGLEFLDDVISIEEIGNRSFFKVFDLQNCVEPPVMGGKIPFQLYTNGDRSDIFDMLLGIASGEKKFSVNVNQEALKKVMGMIFPSEDRSNFFKPADCKFIGIHATARAPIRSIPPEYIKPLSEKIITEFPAKVILFGQLQEANVTPFWSSMSIRSYYADYRRLRELEIPNVINLLDKLNIEEMVALCSLLDFIITSDTAPYHIAAALDKPCLALFGNIAPCTRTTYYPTVKTIYARDINPIPCIPCWDVVESCQPTKYTSDCMRSITPDIIVEKVKQLWE